MATQRHVVYSPPREEGCPSHQITLEGEGGVVAHSETLRASDHPGRSYKVASRHFLNVASTPPHEEGGTTWPKILSITLTAAMVILAAAPLIAHHAFGSEFDPNRPVLLKGKVVKVEWVNPHTWIHMEVTNPDGTKDVWMVEGGSPNSLLRRGVTKASLQPGTEIVVDGYQTRDHTLKRANGRNVTYPDGRKLFLASSADAEAGAPDQK